MMLPSFRKSQLLCSCANRTESWIAVYANLCSTDPEAKSVTTIIIMRILLNSDNCCIIPDFRNWDLPQRQTPTGRKQFRHSLASLIGLLLNLRMCSSHVRDVTHKSVFYTKNNSMEENKMHLVPILLPTCWLVGMSCTNKLVTKGISNFTREF